MSNSYTVTAFIVNGPFGAETRKNAATKYLEHHCKEFFDTNHSNRGNFCTDTFSIRVPNGAQYDKSNNFYPEAIESYYMNLFSDFRHEPYHQIAVENKDGWDLYASMLLYGDVAGEPHGSESKHDAKDSEGRQWDVCIPIYYHFELVNDQNAKYGMKMNHCTLIKDTAAVNSRLDKRGLGDRKPKVP